MKSLLPLLLFTAGCIQPPVTNTTENETVFNLSAPHAPRPAHSLRQIL